MPSTSVNIDHVGPAFDPRDSLLKVSGSYNLATVSSFSEGGTIQESGERSTLIQVPHQTKSWPNSGSESEATKEGHFLCLSYYAPWVGVQPMFSNPRMLVRPKNLGSPWLSGL